MTIAGISQPTWKWTPSLWISDHWSITVRTRKPKIEHGEADLQGEADPAAARRARAEPRPGLADPVQKWLAALHVSAHLSEAASADRSRRPRARRAEPGLG